MAARCGGGREGPPGAQCGSGLRGHPSQRRGGGWRACFAPCVRASAPLRGCSRPSPGPARCTRPCSRTSRCGRPRGRRPPSSRCRGVRVGGGVVGRAPAVAVPAARAGHAAHAGVRRRDDVLALRRGAEEGRKRADWARVGHAGWIKGLE